MFVSALLLSAALAVIWPGNPNTSDWTFGALAGLTNSIAILLLYAAY